MAIRKEITLLRSRIARLGKEAAIYRQTVGLRGILAISAHLLCKHPKVVSLNYAGLKHPLFVRVRTSDAEVYEDIFVLKAYDHQTSTPPRTIVDVGANCGMTSVFYAHRYPDATVVSVEPERSNYLALVRNTRAYPNIIPIHAALWNEDGEVELFPGWPRFKKWGKWGGPSSQGKRLPSFDPSYVDA